MHVSQSHGYLDCIKTSPVFRKASHLTQMHKQFASSHKAHYKENLLFSLKHVAHPYQEWMIGLQQNVFLQACRLDLVKFYYNVFSQRLHCKNFARAFLLYEKYFSKASSPDHLFNYEV